MITMESMHILIAVAASLAAGWALMRCKAALLRYSFSR